MTENTINNARMTLYRSLMAVQHRDYGPLVADLRIAMNSDPDFVARLCAWTAINSNIRDQVDSGIIALLQAPATYPEYREAGRCLLLGSDVYPTIAPERLPGLPPFRILRVIEHIHASTAKVPRMMKSIAHDYLYMLESNNTRFDGVAMLNKRELSGLYFRYHVAASVRARQILFDDNPPADSKAAILKQIANEKDPVKQATMVMEHKIPYTVASSIMPKISPAVGVALVAVMTPAEALNSRRWVEESGLLNMPEVRDAYTAKVAAANKSVATIENRKSAQGTDAGVQDAVNCARETAVASQQRITRPTLLLVDRSGSMETALAVAVSLGAHIAPLMEAGVELGVVLFNDYGQVLPAITGTKLADWERAFRGITANGQTNLQAGFDKALANGYTPEQVVIITDGGINQGVFSQSLRRFNDRAGYYPRIIEIGIGSNHPGVRNDLGNANIPYDSFVFTGDYNLFDQISALLGGPAAKSIVEKVMDTQLPYRQL